MYLLEAATPPGPKGSIPPVSGKEQPGPDPEEPALVQTASNSAQNLSKNWT